MKRIDYSEIEGKSGEYYILLGGFALLFLAGLAAAFHMEHNGHVVTGMSNEIVWGLPHVFAVFLIVCASGALNVASVASVFGKSIYKPLAPLSALLAMALLIGGLTILVLDLGRPDRLVVAMTHYNFKSIFAWNIFLYTGFLAIVGVYLWMMMERRFNAHTKVAGTVAFIWRLVLTTGTGSIFGFLVAREAYDSAIMAPMFIAMSLAFGLAAFILVLVAAYHWTDRKIGWALMTKLKRLLGIFIATVLLLVTTFHVTKLYATKLHGVEQFILVDGGIYTLLFWLVQIVIGCLLPMFFLFHPRFATCLRSTIYSALLVLIGGIAQMYVIIIGGQAYPLDIFPGYEVTSTFFDGAVQSYQPSIAEILLGIGGIALVGVIVTLGVKFLRFLPVSLADADVDPHSKSGTMSDQAAPSGIAPRG